MSTLKDAVGRSLRSILGCIALLALQPSALHAKCRSTNTLAPGDHDFSLDFAGMSRVFMVHVPSSYDGQAPVPLIFDLHGFSGDGPGQVALSGFASVADENNFIVVAPTGYMNSWNGDIAYGAAYDAGLDDVGLMKAIVEYIDGIANINRGKVYATGLSNGAAMSNTLACQAADTFAAVAPVADPLDIGLATCHPTRPISVLGFHGYSDEYVPYEGGAGLGPALPAPFPSIPDTLMNWAEIMKCSGTPEVIAFEGTNKCEIYRECDGDAQVGYCSLEGSHILYSQNNLNIADYAWKFFEPLSLPLADADGDGLDDEDDNCVEVANADQQDANDNCIGDACECSASADCDDGMFCNGDERCESGVCGTGTAACPSGQLCDEDLDRCADGSADPDAGPTVGGAGGANTGTSGHAGQSASGPVSGGSTADGAGSAATAGAAANPSAAGSSGLEPQHQATKSGCGCAPLGSPHASQSILLLLLGIGAVLLRRAAIG